jgi:hypothetical protein
MTLIRISVTQGVIEWTTYVEVVMKLEICEIELIARMFARNDVSNESSRSLTLPEPVDE